MGCQSRRQPASDKIRAYGLRAASEMKYRTVVAAEQALLDSSLLGGVNDLNGRKLSAKDIVLSKRRDTSSG